MLDVIVIGGGIAGLSCAVALADNGLQVAVVERSAHLGGRARSWTDPSTGDAVDIGPHVLHSEYRNMLALLERLGTRECITWQPGTVLTIATRPRPIALRHWPLPPPLSLFPSLVKARGLTLRDHLSMRGPTWRAMRFGEEDVPQLDRISALDFLRQAGVSPRMIDWWWRFAAMVVTNVPLERCSAASLLRIHAQLSGHRHLHFGFGAVGLSELYVPQATRIIEAAGGRVLMQNEVRGFLGSGRAGGVILADGTQLRARHCVSALPPQALADILPVNWKAYFMKLNAFEPSPYISCYLWFDRQITQQRFVSHLWSPTRLNYDFYDLSKIRHGWEGRPSVLASNIIYSHRAHGMRDDAIIEATLKEIAEFAPTVARARLRHASLHRIPMAIPCPTTGFESRRPQTRSAVPGLLVAGDWVQTQLPCSMESAVKSGFLAAEQVLADRNQPCRLAHPQREYDGLSGMARRVASWYRHRKGHSSDAA